MVGRVGGASEEITLNARKLIFCISKFHDGAFTIRIGPVSDLIRACALPSGPGILDRGWHQECWLMFAPVYLFCFGLGVSFEYSEISEISIVVENFIVFGNL